MKPSLLVLTALVLLSARVSFCLATGNHLGQAEGSVKDPSFVVAKRYHRSCSPFHLCEECRLRHGRSKRSNNMKDFPTTGNFKKHSRNSEKAPSFKHVFQETTVRPGVYVSLSCVAQGMPVPHMTWILDRTRSLSSRPGVRVNSYVATRHEVRGSINFTMVDIRDSGVYSCVATNPQGTALHSARLNVMGSLFMRSPQNVSTVAGLTNFVECPFGGYPFNEVKWERDGRTLPTNQRQQVFDNGTLAIIEVDKAQDEGKYLCTVIGMDGKFLSTSFHVFVKVRPKVAPFTFQINLQESMRTAVTCVVLGGDPPMRLWWQKDGIVLNENDLEANVLTAEDGFFSTLNIKHLYVRHNGNYSCIAQNSVGSDSQSALLRVKVAPRWLLEPKDTSAVVGNAVTIDCQAEGVPEPHVRWKVAANSESPRKNYKTLISSSRIQILVNGSLSIRGVQKSDAGSYLCEANNGVGSGLSTVIMLNVFSVPSTFPKSQSVQVVKGQSILLNCSATGDLPIRFTWNKEGELFSPGMDPRFEVTEKLSETISTSTLSVDGVERRDSGLFLCTARNDYGSDTMRLMVKVQEKPDPPKDLQAKEIESRSVTLTWLESFSGNLPLLRNVVMWRLADANWVRNIPPVVVPGTETSITVPDLKPLTSYVFQIKAENNLGSSDFSPELTVTTLDEPPRFAPTGVRATSETSQSVTVIWEVPPDVSNSTHIDGFFVGIKQRNSREQYSFKTIDRKARQEIRLDSLIPSTDYSVIVQAFNGKGPGPASEEIIARTLEYDPPEAPAFRISSTSASSIQLSWVTESNHYTPVTGYKIYYKTEEGPWQETHAGNSTTVFNVRELKCGTKYGFYIAAYNRAGRSDPSKIIYATTDGGPPEVPEQRDLFSVNSTYMIAHLRAWKSGGCPIAFFVIKYRQTDHQEWTLVSNNIIPQQQHIYIYDLTPATWYVVSLTAHNDAGSTGRDYEVGTLTLHGEYPPTPAEKSNANSALQRHFTITIPIASSVIVLVVVLLVVYVITRRRNAPQRLNSAQGGDMCEHTKNESLPLSVTGDHAMEPTYLVSPYGVARSQSQRETACQRQKLDDNLRTFGRPQSDHVYDVPFPVKRAEASRSYPQYNSRSPVPSERDYSYKKPSYRKGGKRYRSRSWREEGDGSSGNDSDSEYLSDVLMSVQNVPKEGSETESDRQCKLQESRSAELILWKENTYEAVDFHDEFSGKMPKQRDVLIHGRSIVV